MKKIKINTTKKVGKLSKFINKKFTSKNKNKTIKATKKATKKSNYLQDKLQEYTTTKNIDNLLYVAYVVVKKVCSKYATNNSQTMQLYQASRNPFSKQQDIQDLRQVAVLSLYQDLTQNIILDYTKIFKNSFSNVNKYLYHLRGVKLSCRPFDFSIEQLQANNKDIVFNVSKSINQIINNNEYYTDTDNTDPTNTDKKRQLINAIMLALTPTQKTIVKYLSKGYSQRQIASKLNRGVSTINEHIKNIRKVSENIANNQNYKF